VIENGVDVQKFANASSNRLQPHLLYFGRWSVNKGLLESLDILAALRAQHPDTPWQLTIAGREYDLDLDTLRTQAHLRGVSDRVRLVASPSEAVLRRCIARASYFLCLSRHEGFGIAPIEGMSAGLIPLLSDIPPFRKLLERAQVGLLLPAGSATAQASLIQSLHERLSMQAHSAFLARETAQAAAQVYAWSQVAGRYACQYHEMVGTE
jgi:alpha-1,3-mannosyltransferase